MKKNEGKTKKGKKVENVEVAEKEIFSQKTQYRIIKALLKKDFLYAYNGKFAFWYKIGTEKMGMFALIEKFII